MDPHVKISADSTCDLAPEMVRDLGITLAPLYVIFGEDARRDGVDADPEMIFAHVKETNELPSTSAVSEADYEEIFGQMTADGSEVVHFSLSSEISSSYQNACLAAREIPGVHVVDTRNLSSGSGLTILWAAREAKEGLAVEEIIRNAESRIPRVETSFVLDKLDYMAKGGRCSAVTAFGANLLKLRISISLKDGKLGMDKKYRGSMERALKEYVAEHIKERDDILSPIFITDSGVTNEIREKVAGWIGEYQPQLEILYSRAGCTISSHCGNGTLGILFIRKED